MDYLCELPNDSSRRKALGSLPPTLNATYERILRHVNASNNEVQLLVSRTLKWIVHRQRSTNLDHLPDEALCEAVSISMGDTRRDTDKISDEYEMLRRCSSLVRKGADDGSLELAHFTVEEFLLQLGDEESGEFASYRVGFEYVESEVAKVCLTYLNFRDFNHAVHIGEAVSERRLKEYPLRFYAVIDWVNYAQPRLADQELLSLAKQLLSPSKPGTLLSWFQDYIYLCTDHEQDQLLLETIHRGTAEASALHFASILSLPEVCSWLIDSGDCDLNQTSVFGTPLQSAFHAFEPIRHWGQPFSVPVPWEDLLIPKELGRVVHILLAAGADPNPSHGTKSPLFMSLEHCNFNVAIQLIDKGARLDGHCVKLLETYNDDGVESKNIQELMDRFRGQAVEAQDYSRILKVTTHFRHPGNQTRMPGINMAKHPTKQECESALRTAAAFGQTEVINQILGDQSTDLEAADEETGFTALHCAAMNDHVNVVKLLISHGAKLNKVDFEGRQATHHAIAGVGVRCLEYLIPTISIDTLHHDKGLSVWHWAAIKPTKQALETLARYSTAMPSLSGIRTKAGWSPLLSAASAGSAENIEWLLRAGCKITDKADDGSTALHLTSQSGVSGAVQVLLENGSEVSALTNDGSTALHLAILDIKEETTVVLQSLLEERLDASHAQDDGVMPIHLLISQCANISTWEDPSRSEWLLDTFRVLVSRTDLGTENPTGKSTVQLLADTWQKFCLGRIGRGNPHTTDKAMTTVTKMMHMAMDRLRLTGISQSWCIDPCYTVTALTIHDEELANKFLNHLPDVDAVTGNSSIIEAACLSGCSSTILKELLLRSKVPSDNNQVKGLVRSVCDANLIANGHEVVKVLLEAGFSPNDSCPSSGQTPLMIAAYDGNTDLMEVLLSNGADIHAQDKHGRNVAHFACMGRYLEAVKILRTTAVDWNKQGDVVIDSVYFNGISPLHIAAADSESHLLGFLFDESLVTDIDIVTGHSETSLHIAAWLSRPLNVSLLLSRNANATIKCGKLSETPLHVAARFGREAVVRVFLEYNCDINILDGGGLDCETLAKKYGHKGVEMILREYREAQGEIRRLLC